MISTTYAAISGDQASRIRESVLALVASANENMPSERKVSYGTAVRVADRSMLETDGLPFSIREHRAVKDISDFISLVQHNKTNLPKPKNTDLLLVGHPRSTKPHAMTAAAVKHEKARWAASDPRIEDEEIRAIVSSALSAAPNTPEYDYYRIRLIDLPVGSVPKALVAAFGDGNSSAARSARARLQRRDRKGRFAWMGGGLRALVRRAGGIFSLSGRMVGQGVGTDDTFDMELPDGRLVRVPAQRAEGLKAVITRPGADGYSPRPARVKSGDPVIDESELIEIDSPNGFRRDESYDGPGVRYTDDAYDVVRFDAGDPEAPALPEGVTLDPNRPILAAARRDGDKAGEVFEVSQSWANIQDKIRADEVDLDRSEGREPDPIATLDDAEFERLRNAIGDTDRDPLEVLRELRGEQAPAAERRGTPDMSDFEFDAGDDAYLFDTTEEYMPRGPRRGDSADYTDEPELLADMFDSDDLIDAMRQGVLPDEDGNEGSGRGALDFGEGDELVPVEAIHAALREQGVDADMELARIYDENNGNTDNVDRLNAFRGGETAAEPKAELPEDEETPLEATMPPLFEGLSRREQQRILDTGEWEDYLSPNEEVEMPEGYYQLDGANFDPEGDWRTDPLNNTREYTQEQLEAAFRESLEPSATPGYGTLTKVDADGEEVSISVPAESLRDSLKMLNVDTDELVNNIASEGREGQAEIDDAEAARILEDEDGQLAWDFTEEEVSQAKEDADALGYEGVSELIDEEPSVDEIIERIYAVGGDDLIRQVFGSRFEQDLYDRETAEFVEEPTEEQLEKWTRMDRFLNFMERLGGGPGFIQSEFKPKDGSGDSRLQRDKKAREARKRAEEGEGEDGTFKYTGGVKMPPEEQAFIDELKKRRQEMDGEEPLTPAEERAEEKVKDEVEEWRERNRRRAERDRERLPKVLQDRIDEIDRELDELDPDDEDAWIELVAERIRYQQMLDDLTNPAAGRGGGGGRRRRPRRPAGEGGEGRAPRPRRPRREPEPGETPTPDAGEERRPFPEVPENETEAERIKRKSDLSNWTDEELEEEMAQIQEELKVKTYGDGRMEALSRRWLELKAELDSRRSGGRRPSGGGERAPQPRRPRTPEPTPAPEPSDVTPTPEPEPAPAPAPRRPKPQGPVIVEERRPDGGLTQTVEVYGRDYIAEAVREPDGSYTIRVRPVDTDAADFPYGLVGEGYTQEQADTVVRNLGRELANDNSPYIDDPELEKRRQRLNERGATPQPPIEELPDSTTPESVEEVFEKVSEETTKAPEDETPEQEEERLTEDVADVEETTPEDVAEFIAPQEPPRLRENPVQRRRREAEDRRRAAANGRDDAAPDVEILQGLRAGRQRLGRGAGDRLNAARDQLKKLFAGWESRGRKMPRPEHTIITREADPTLVADADYKDRFGRIIRPGDVVAHRRVGDLINPDREAVNLIQGIVVDRGTIVRRDENGREKTYKGYLTVLVTESDDPEWVGEYFTYAAGETEILAQPDLRDQANSMELTETQQTEKTLWRMNDETLYALYFGNRSLYPNEVSGEENTRTVIERELAARGLINPQDLGDLLTYITDEGLAALPEDIGRQEGAQGRIVRELIRNERERRRIGGRQDRPGTITLPREIGAIMLDKSNNRAVPDLAPDSGQSPPSPPSPPGGLGGPGGPPPSGGDLGDGPALDERSIPERYVPSDAESISAQGEFEGDPNTRGLSDSELGNVSELSTNQNAVQSDYSSNGWDSQRAAEIAEAARSRASAQGLADLISRYNRGEVPRADVERAIADAYGVGRLTFGDKDMELVPERISFSMDRNGDAINITANLKFLNPDGVMVGKVDRGLYINLRNPELSYAENEYFRITDDAYKGGGTADSYNRWMENWYIANNISRVNVHAVGDGTPTWTGGVTWALNNFEFDNKEAMTERVLSNMENKLRNVPADQREGIERDIKRIRDRIELAKQSGDMSLYPTPLHLALVGWRPGIEKDWFGYGVMWDTNWYGHKILTASSINQMERLAYDDIMRVARDRVKKGENSFTPSADVTRELGNADVYTNRENEVIAPYRDEIIPFISASRQGRSLAALSPAARHALSVWANRKLDSVQDRESSEELARLIFSLREESIAYDKVNDSLGNRGEILRRLSESDLPARDEDDLGKWVPVSYNGQDTGFVARLLPKSGGIDSESGISNTWMVRDTQTNQMYFIKKDHPQPWYGNARTELESNIIGRVLGNRGLPRVELSDDPTLMVTTFAGDGNLNAVQTWRPADEYHYEESMMIDDLYDRLAIADLTSLGIFDLIINHGDRHQGNFLLQNVGNYGVRGSDLRESIIPLMIDNGISDLGNETDFRGIRDGGPGDLNMLLTTRLNDMTPEARRAIVRENAQRALDRLLQSRDPRLSQRATDIVIEKLRELLAIDDNFYNW